MEEKALSKEKGKTRQERLADKRKELAAQAQAERLRTLAVRSPCSPALSHHL